MNLLSRHAMPLPKLSVNSWNTLFTVAVFHTAVLLIKELTSWHQKCGKEPKLIEFTDATILKQLAWQNGGTAF